jgi:hypothetical protein
VCLAVAAKTARQISRVTLPKAHFPLRELGAPTSAAPAGIGIQIPVGAIAALKCPSQDCCRVLPDGGAGTRQVTQPYFGERDCGCSTRCPFGTTASKVASPGGICLASAAGTPASGVLRLADHARKSIPTHRSAATAAAVTTPVPQPTSGTATASRHAPRRGAHPQKAV